VRAQSNVVGVALLVAATVVAVAAMTVTVGTVVEQRAGAVAADRTADGLADALDPHATGPRTERVTTFGGTVRVVERTVRVFDGDRQVLILDAGGVVYTNGRHRTAAVAGVVVRGRGSGSVVHTPPSTGVRDGAVVAGVTTLGATPRVVPDASSVAFRANVTHERRRLAPGDYRIAIETATPTALARAAPDDARTYRRDFDDDGVPSLVVDYPSSGRLVLTVHLLDLGVSAA
jgi:flagellin-like protein